METKQSGPTIREATEGDVPLILDFIRGLAEYENLTDQMSANEEELRTWIFHKNAAMVLIAEESGSPVGFALYFHSFSTFLGRPGLYLEDLFVRPAFRGRGYGLALLKRLAAIAVEKGFGRLEWACLDWNRPSIDFYLSLPSMPLNDWTVYRVTGQNLINLAEKG